MMRTFAAMLAFLLTFAGLGDAAERKASRVAVPTFNAAANGESCVAPTDEMRRDHMDMLVHQRDRTVRQGIRDTRFSLKNCVDCHADRNTGSVLGKEGFCSSCHAYASVKIDCFECHSPVRQAGTGRVPR